MTFWGLTIPATAALIVALQSAAQGRLAEAYTALLFGVGLGAFAAMASRGKGGDQ